MKHTSAIVLVVVVGIEKAGRGAKALHLSRYIQLVLSRSFSLLWIGPVHLELRTGMVDTPPVHRATSTVVKSSDGVFNRGRFKALGWSNCGLRG